MSRIKVSKDRKDQVIQAWGMGQMKERGPMSARNQRRVAKKAAKKERSK